MSLIAIIKQLRLNRISQGFLFLYIMFGPSQGFAMTLKEAIQTAMSHDSSQLARGSIEERAREGKSQAWSRIMPSLSAVATHTRQDKPGPVSSQNTGNVQLNLTQPLFQGLREYSGLKGAGASIDIAVLDTLDSKGELTMSVAAAFFNVLFQESEGRSLSELSRLTEERVDELKKRTRVGRSRIGDLLAAQSQLAFLSAEIELQKANLTARKSEFHRLVGVIPEKLTDNAPSFAGIQSLESYLQKLDARPDVRSQMARVELANAQVQDAQSGHWPQVELFGNYFPSRWGVANRSQWNVGVSASLSLFEGGRIESEVSEAEANRAEARFNLEDIRRRARTEIETVHSALLFGGKQLSLLQEALTHAEKNYAAQTKDFRFGLATNLDVLSALNQLIEVRRTLDRRTFELKVIQVQLSVVTGAIE